ncbi:MAG: hypothetical protein IPI75_04370 [Gammaproteobacteria bacterium]|nr:hypothetical protein [Gammaproteobacteria bacterium]
MPRKTKRDLLPEWLLPQRPKALGLDGAVYQTSKHHRVLHRPERVWPILIELVANGVSLTAALRRLDPTPSYWWAQNCLKQDSELRARYMAAVESRGDFLAEELIELADTPIPSYLDGAERSAWVAMQKLRIDVRRWCASKCRPFVYGDRIDVAVTSTQISIKAALEEAQQRVINGMVEREAEVHQLEQRGVCSTVDAEPQDQLPGDSE